LQEVWSAFRTSAHYSTKPTERHESNFAAL